MESPMRAGLELASSHLVGVGKLAALMPEACLPLPKPFGLHMRNGLEIPAILHGCTIEARADLMPEEGGDIIADHCAYAVQYEFPWLPFVDGLHSAPDIKAGMASAIEKHVKNDSRMARRWWFMYEAILQEQLPIRSSSGGGAADDPVFSLVPLLPPDRFFCSSGRPSRRHGVLDNLLGDARLFCPFVERFAGSADAAAEFQAELFEVLSPICMMTIKEFLKQVGLHDGSEVTDDKFAALVARLAEGGFAMNVVEKQELRRALAGHESPKGDARQVKTYIVDFASWLRGTGKLACRLREHLLEASPSDLRWHAPGEQFMDRLSRVISSIETRASQMIEGELPPEKKQRYMVDVLSSPWEREIRIDPDLICRLQKGLLLPAKYENVVASQVPGEPRRVNQNWVSSEKYDEMVGKTRVCHHLPPPPQALPKLLEGYFVCLNRMLDDPNVDPIVAATIAKIAFNVMHPLVDGNGRVQRVLFQLVLFKRGFLPRMNVPVSVIMLQDRTGYEVLQQKHVDQTMAGCVYEEGKSDVEEGGDDFQHVNATDGIAALYKYQDFTFATSAMIKLMQGTLPVIAAKAYFLQRFDWRVDELLKGDALLPARAATKIAKVFKNDGQGLSIMKLAKLLFLDGWQLGFKRVLRFLTIAKHPSDIFGLQRLRQKAALEYVRSKRRLWVMSTGQISASSASGRVSWVGISLNKFKASEFALKRAIADSDAGDTVLAVHYPKNMDTYFSMDLFPDVAPALQEEMQDIRREVIEKVQRVAAECGATDRGVNFRWLIGSSSEYKPAYALCEDVMAAEVKPDRLYVGYDNEEHHRSFTEYIVRNAPCDVAVIKNDVTKKGIVRWVGISERNFEISRAALAKAFQRSRPGDTVVAVHYPINPFGGDGLSSVYCEHFGSLTSLAEAHVDTIVDSVNSRVAERAQRVADELRKEGVEFRTMIGERSHQPHLRLVMDATTCHPRPHGIYIGYTRRRDRKRLVDPHKLHDVAEYVVRNAPCNVLLVKETQEEQALRVKEQRDRGLG